MSYGHVMPVWWSFIWRWGVMNLGFEILVMLTFHLIDTATRVEPYMISARDGLYWLFYLLTSWWAIRVALIKHNFRKTEKGVAAAD